MTRRSLAALAAACALGASPASAAGRWQIVGSTYNSVVFLDRGSMQRSGSRVDVIALRMITGLKYSGQPGSEHGWTVSTNLLRLDCARRTALDRGTQVEMPNGKVDTFPAILRPMTIPSRGPMTDLFSAACASAGGETVDNPRAYAKRTFRPH